MNENEINKNVKNGEDRDFPIEKRGEERSTDNYKENDGREGKGRGKGSKW